MLKFTEIDSENKDEIVERLFDKDENVADVIDDFDLDDPDLSFAVTRAYGCLLVRIFDLGRYVFVFPLPIDESADVKKAILALSEYAMREELPFKISYVCSEDIPLFAELGFRHMELDFEDEGIYRLRVRTECELLSEIPEFEVGGLSASALTEDDIEAYAELSRDPELNRFWGYDYREDEPDASDAFFYSAQEQGFLRGASMTLGLRKDGELVGALELFAFDGRGGAECAVKIAGSHQGRGYGSLGLELAFEAARRMTLSRVHCDVMKKNVNSVKMVKKYFDECESEFSDRYRFVKEIS